MNEFLGRGTSGAPCGGRGRGTRRIVTGRKRRGSSSEGADDGESGENEGPGSDGVSKVTN